MDVNRNEYVKKLIGLKLKEYDDNSNETHLNYLYDDNNLRFWCYDVNQNIYILEELEYDEECKSKVKSVIFLSSEDFMPLINVFKNELFKRMNK